jgi:glycerol uptake facilitator-like aquaporin
MSKIFVNRNEAFISIYYKLYKHKVEHTMSDLIKYAVEFVGTFLFLSTIVATGQPILIAIALLLVILIGGGISGGHFNPAVSVMFYAKGALTSQDLLAYICAQVLGGLAALAAYLALVKPATPVVV